MAKVAGLEKRFWVRSKRFFLTSLLAAIGALLACQREDPEIVRCTGIPEGGCPDRAGVDDCIDRACAALYRCNADRSWTQTKVCADRGDAAASDASRPEASAPRDASIDAPIPPGAGGGPGCGDLVLPDCNALFALGCPTGCCGCEDVFVCENGGWNSWATCADGRLTLTK